jgi:hypothetical protein
LGKDVIFNLVGTKIFRSQNYLKIKAKSIFLSPQAKRSNGPDEVFNSLSKYKGVKRIKNSKEIFEIESKNIVIMRDFLDEIPNKIVDIFSGMNVLLGPNIDFLLERNSRVLKLLPRAVLLVPSEWVVNVLKSNDVLANYKYAIWSAGVDTRHWSTKKRGKRSRRRVLIYVKSEIEDRAICKIQNTLESLGYFNKVVTYGSYHNSAFRRLLKGTDFVIWLGSTESQGIAQFQSWAMGVPTLVQRKNSYSLNGIEYPSSASPYLSTETGCFTKTETISSVDIEEFVNSLHLRNPRRWIENNATLEITGSKLSMIFNAEFSDFPEKKFV